MKSKQKSDFDYGDSVEEIDESYHSESDSGDADGSQQEMLGGDDEMRF